jgi:predicted DNA-binding mobile mystery protein A
MRDHFKTLRLKQLDRALAPFRSAMDASRPVKGWVRAIREALGVSSVELAGRMGASRQLVVQQEKAEAEDRITLKSLRALANALDCDLVYALVPRAGSLEELMKDRARIEARKRVTRVEHSMALEGQAVGDVDEAIEEETRRLVAKRAGR